MAALNIDSIIQELSLSNAKVMNGGKSERVKEVKKVLSELNEKVYNAFKVNSNEMALNHLKKTESILNVHFVMKE